MVAIKLFKYFHLSILGQVVILLMFQSFLNLSQLYNIFADHNEVAVLILKSFQSRDHCTDQLGFIYLLDKDQLV